MNNFVLKSLNSIDRKVFIRSAFFSLSLIAFEWLLLSVNYKGFIGHFYAKEFDRYSIFGPLFLLFSLLIFFLFTYFSFVSSWRFKIIYFLIFFFAVFHEYGYQNAYGRFSDIVDLSSTSASTPEQKLNAIATYINLVAIIPCIAFLFVLVKQKSEIVTHSLKSFLLIILLFISFYSALWYVFPKLHTDTFPTVSIGAFTNTAVSYALFNEFSYKKERQLVEQPAISPDFRPDNNIVFIVDESVRGDHLSLNGYQRKTTPFLDELAASNILKNWGIAASSSTCSLTSHNLLITGLKTDDMPDTDDLVRKVPSIFEYAKAMRYKTHYLDAQMTTFWGGTKDDLSYIDDWRNAATFIESVNWRWDNDFKIAKKVNEIINTSKGNFIFVFKHGNHTPYSRNFPESEATWKPSYDGWRANFSGIVVDFSDEQIPAMINSYDNGIKYNLDTFFKYISSDYNELPNNTILVYTSDHGQTLSEGGLTYTHCGNNPKEAIVPLFIIGDLKKPVDTDFKASHENLFATILDLMEYPVSLRKRDYAISLLKAKASDSKERYFVSANLIKGIKIKFDDTHQ